jgi:outer membrane protein
LPLINPGFDGDQAAKARRFVIGKVVLRLMAVKRISADVGNAQHVMEGAEMSKWGVAAFAALAAAAFAQPTQAGVLDNFQVKVGVSGVFPDESGDPIPVGISDEVVPSLQIEYFFNDHVSAEILCCVATHDVTAAGGAVDLGEVTHFPPTVTLKYRWTTFGRVEPYVGAGVNFTAFIDSEPPAGRHVDYDSSVGPALQAGLDYRLDDHWALNFDVRRIWINTDVTISGDINATDEVDIDPWVISTAIAYRF